MLSIISIEKNGSVTEKKIKNIDKLYSVCNYRTDKDFEKLHEWDNDNDSILELYGKKTGKQNNENKYLLPNINRTFYGNLCIIKKDGSLTIDEWNLFYNMYNIPENESCIEETSDDELNYSVVSDIELTYEEYEEELII